LPNSARRDNAQLLFDETLNDWRSWFAEADSKWPEFTLGCNTSDHGQMLQAAIQGLMVCLASERLAHRNLAEGRLVKAEAV
jgi:DNA-binding transcriptional LysR family regulator